jgi:hypothetical protein
LCQTIQPYGSLKAGTQNVFILDSDKLALSGAALMPHQPLDQHKRTLNTLPPD